MPIEFPGESAEYRAARDRLLQAEVDLRRQMEAVAVARRALPPGGIVPEDYVFDDVRFSELFAPGKDTLLIYSFMFPRDPRDDRPGPRDGPCPSCVALLDQLDGVVEHLEQHANFYVAAKAPLPALREVAEQRGWRRLRLISSGGNSYNRDYHSETAEGHQLPMLNVFQRDGEAIRHFWASELFFAPTDPGQETRHVGTIEPLFNMLDLIPGGRPADWDEQLSYPA
jgi:predicted dithiol-disulfide oxidoreductase (DUF899 family)